MAHVTAVTWEIQVERGDGDDWPLVPMYDGDDSCWIRPDTIDVSWEQVQNGAVAMLTLLPVDVHGTVTGPAIATVRAGIERQLPVNRLPVFVRYAVELAAAAIGIETTPQMFELPAKAPLLAPVKETPQ
jgi:hypothetical protein